MNFFSLIKVSYENEQRTIRVDWRRLVMGTFYLSVVLWLAVSLVTWIFVSRFRDFPEAKFTDILLPSRWSDYRHAQGDHYIAQAEKFIAQSDYLSAFTKLRLGVAKAPTNPRGRVLLAQFYTANRRPDLAEDILLQGLPLLPGNQGYLRNVLNFLLEYHEDAKLSALARELLRSDTLSADAKRIVAFFAASAAYFRGYYDQAEDLISHYRLIENTDGVLLQSRLDWERGYREFALLRLQSHLEHAPDDESVYVQLGQFFREQGNHRDLEKIAVQRLALNPLSHLPRLEFLYLYDQQQLIARLNQEIASYLRNFSRDPAALILLAEFAANTGRPALAHQVFDNIQAGLHTPEGPALMVAEAHIVAHEYQTALDLLTAYSRNSPTWAKQFASVFNGLQAVALYGLHRPDEAGLFLQHLLTQENSRAENLVAVSNRLVAIGAREQARMLLARAVAADELNQAALTQLVRLETEDDDMSPLPAHLRILLKMRKPSREVLQAALGKLGSDLNIFLVPQAELLSALKTALAPPVAQKI